MEDKGEDAMDVDNLLESLTAPRRRENAQRVSFSQRVHAVGARLHHVCGMPSHLYTAGGDAIPRDGTQRDEAHAWARESATWDEAAAAEAVPLARAFGAPTLSTFRHAAALALEKEESQGAGVTFLCDGGEEEVHAPSRSLRSLTNTCATIKHMLDPLDCGSSSDAEEAVRMVMPPVVHTQALKATIDYCTLRESCGTPTTALILSAG